MISINTLNYIDIKRAFRIRCIMLILEKLNITYIQYYLVFGNLFCSRRVLKLLLTRLLEIFNCLAISL